MSGTGITYQKTSHKVSDSYPLPKANRPTNKHKHLLGHSVENVSQGQKREVHVIVIHLQKHIPIYCQAQFVIIECPCKSVKVQQRLVAS